MESLPFIAWCLEHLNYFTITLLIAIESSFIPFPSEIVIPPAAYLAASTGEMSVVGIFFFGTLGALIGSSVNYFLALWLGRPIIYAFAESKVGAFFLLSKDGVQKAEKYFVDHGKAATFTGRLIPGIRQLISIPAGLARMPLLPFYLYTTLGAGIWNIVLIALGWYLEGVVPMDQLAPIVSQYSHEIGGVILAIVVIILAVMMYRAHRRKSLDEHLGEDSPAEKDH